jgi:5'-methylthioadenosine phosphorylase
MEGPAFSTRAESVQNHQCGFSVIGMTNLGEARCAREAEIAYATMAMVTDYDCWKTDEPHVTVEIILDNLRKNAEQAKRIVKEVIPSIPIEPGWLAHSALHNSILTARKYWPARTFNDLKPILGKYA